MVWRFFLEKKKYHLQPFATFRGKCKKWKTLITVPFASKMYGQWYFFVDIQRVPSVRNRSKYVTCAGNRLQGKLTFSHDQGHMKGRQTV